ncbi:SMI1/KNR4 family protein [Rhodovulum sp. DZ06]|uniref:SMI1/KNR4 family protein n=1 Tax=Rhodovulum sp. DZ06 TaxID=3425126 RepID=UPI003D333D07
MLTDDALAVLRAMKTDGPLPPAAIAEIEALVGAPLPDDLRQVYEAVGLPSGFTGGGPAEAETPDDAALEIAFFELDALQGLYAQLRDPELDFDPALLEGWFVFATNGIGYEYACRAGDPRVHVCGLFNPDSADGPAPLAADLSTLLTRATWKDFEAAEDLLLD